MSERPPLATIPAGRDAFGPIRMVWRDGLEKCESFRGVRTTIQAAFEHGLGGLLRACVFETSERRGSKCGLRCPVRVRPVLAFAGCREWFPRTMRLPSQFLVATVLGREGPM